MRFLLDTNVASEWVRPSPDAGVVAWLAALDEDRAYLSVITIAELSRAIALMRPSRRREALDLWLNQDLIDRFSGRILGIDQAVAEAWGPIMAQARKSGATLDAMDGFLAATAHIHDLTLATRNERDFARLDLRLANPWKL